MTLWLLLACAPAPLTRLAGGYRLAESATGEILVGTRTGQVWAVNLFGEATLLPGFEGPQGEAPTAAVEVLQVSAVGEYWLQDTAGAIWRGTRWSAPTRLAQGRLLGRTCEEVVWEVEPSEVTALSFTSTCGVARGDAHGAIDGVTVSDAPIAALTPLDAGLLWRDSVGGFGCLGCDLPPFPTPPVDGIPLHLPPLPPASFATIDAEGSLWLITP